MLDAPEGANGTALLLPSVALVFLNLAGELNEQLDALLNDSEIDHFARGVHVAKGNGYETTGYAAVGHLDGSGIGAIAFLRKRLLAAGQSLDVSGAHGQPLSLLRQLGLARSFGLSEEQRPFWANLLRPLPGMGWGVTRGAQA